MKFKNLDNILDQIQSFLSSKDKTIDVPNVLDLDEPYITHRPLEEQDEKPKEEVSDKEPIEKEEPKETKPPIEKILPEEPKETIPSGERDPMGMGMMGIEKEEPLETSEVGRIYELKKIYSRLASIESYLSLSSDTILLKLRNFVSQALDLFETLISNIESYKDDLDDIIVMFYKFLSIVYTLLKQYYEIKKSEEKK